MSVILVIGLPASGKSHYVQQHLIDDEYEVFDDFISNFYNEQAIQSIKAGKNVWLIDPRLCIPQVFQHYIQIVEQLIQKNVNNPQKIRLILFEIIHTSVFVTMMHEVVPQFPLML